MAANQQSNDDVIQQALKGGVPADKVPELIEKLKADPSVTTISIIESETKK